MTCLTYNVNLKENLMNIKVKVEKILKGSLDSPSPSVKIQIMGGKVCLMCEGKTLLGVENKKFVDITQPRSQVDSLHLAMFCLINPSNLSRQ